MGSRLPLTFARQQETNKNVDPPNTNLSNLAGYSVVTSAFKRIK